MMDVERIALLAGMGLVIAITFFIFWGPLPKPRKKGKF